MKKINQEIITGKQPANTVQQNKEDNELDSQNNQSRSLDVIFGSKNNCPDVIFGSKENNQEQDGLELDSKQNDLEREKQKILKNLENQEGFTDADRKNNENKLKKLAEIPVKEKSDYFFFVLVASTAIGGPIGFALASLACEKLGIQPGGVIEDSRSFNSDAITTPIIKTLNEIILAVNQYDSYDKSLAPALITGFKSAVDLIKEEVNPKNQTTPTSKQCLGEAKESKHVSKFKNQKNQGHGNLNQNK